MVRRVEVVLDVTLEEARLPDRPLADDDNLELHPAEAHPDTGSRCQDKKPLHNSS